jgi:hypothetical protein
MFSREYFQVKIALITVEEYIWIFYIIYEGDIPFLQLNLYSGPLKLSRKNNSPDFLLQYPLCSSDYNTTTQQLHRAAHFSYFSVV